jgi:hypothetical protein
MKTTFFGLLFLALPFALFSQDKSSKEEYEKKNQISVFLGATSNSNATVFTIGLDYQYRINKIIGVGVMVADYATGSLGSLLIGPSVYLHASHFEFTLVPAVEFSEGDATFVFRFGAAYEIELPKGVIISPVVYFDTERNEESALVYGLSFGFGF